MYSFPVLIKKIRESSGLTQKEFAQVLSVSPILISMVEVGQKEVSKNLIIRLANNLKVHPNAITPFLFPADNMPYKDLSPIEKNLINFGERLQEHLIKKKSKNIRLEHEKIPNLSSNKLRK